MDDLEQNIQYTPQKTEAPKPSPTAAPKPSKPMPLFDPDIRSRQIRDALFYWLLIPASVLGTGSLLDRLLGLPTFPTSPTLNILAILLLISGLWLIHRASRELRQIGHGTPNPFRPPKILVASGVYACCRHPMFLGYDLGALAVLLLCRSWGMLLGSFPIFLAWQIRFLLREEKILYRRFPEDYARYRKRVPFLLPRLLPRP